MWRRSKRGETGGEVVFFIACCGLFLLSTAVRVTTRTDASLAAPPQGLVVEEDLTSVERAPGGRVEASALAERERSDPTRGEVLGQGGAARATASPTYTGLDPERFAPTLETCVAWMATVDRTYPERVREIWPVDPKFREAWATTQEYHALHDVLSLYDETQLERFQTHQPTESLLDFVGLEGRAALHRLVPDKAAPYDALDLYDAEVQNHLWMAGEETEHQPTLDAYWSLLRVIQESDPTSQAAEYMRRRITEATK